VIGNKGQGPEEYTSISSFFVKENNVILYDGELQKMFIYNFDGTFVTSKKTDNNISSIYPINNKNFIGKQKYQGDKIQTPSLTIIDENLDHIYTINNRFLTSGIGVYDYCYFFDDNILYWEFLNDTIFSVEGGYIMPRYYVDFHKYKIPKAERKNREFYYIVEYINSTPKLAFGIRYIQEDQFHIRFIFSFDENINYVRYNKQTKEVLLVYFYDSEKKLDVQYFMKYNDGKIFLSVYDIDDADSNPKLVIIDENTLFN
jgi:hypothetical protein